MSRNLTEDQVETVSSLMDWIHTEILASRGLAPRTGDWRRKLDTLNLQQLAKLDAGPPGIPVSHRKRVGKVVERARALLWRLLTPAFEAELASRRLARAVLEDLIADRSRLFAEIDMLKGRLEITEARIRQIEEKSGPKT